MAQGARAAGSVPEIRYARFACSAQVLCTYMVLCPEPSTTSRCASASSATPSRAPGSGVDGSWRLLMARIGAEDFRFHGPRYGWTAPVGQYAQVIMSNTPLPPKHG